MPLPEILATYRPPAGGDTWERAIPDLLADPDDARVVELLRAELAAYGDFREPIVVEPAERDILDGLHRIVAAVLTEHAALDVADTYEDLPERRRIRVVLAVPGLTSAAVDRLATVLRSFPLAGDWTTCDLLLPGDGQVTGWWTCPAGLDERLGAELASRATEAGLRLSLLAISDVDAG
ncbi:hypothetical protein [Actinoplanes siamensis]|nr:hypothetical protein [Actinoplanes siamensis]